MNKEEYIKREEGAMLHTYNRFPVVLEKGEGVYLYDTCLLYTSPSPRD